jgi:hypothetical protein
MKTMGKFLICLAGGLAFNANLRADEVVLPGNPYATIVVRNIFGLNPPLPVDPAANDKTPPPKITPNGIMSIFGQLQVLFKVDSTAKPGKPAGDDDYILSEGQRQDDIEVVKINEKAGSVTFNNHGTVQELLLVSATPTSSGPIAGANPASFQPSPGNGTRFNRNGGNFNGTYGGRNRGNGNSGGYGGANNNGGAGNGGNSGNNSNGMGNGPSLGNVPVRNNTFNAADQIPEGVTSETQPILIEANRIATQQQVDNGELAPLPFTELTPQ